MVDQDAARSASRRAECRNGVKPQAQHSLSAKTRHQIRQRACRGTVLVRYRGSSSSTSRAEPRPSRLKRRADGGLLSAARPRAILSYCATLAFVAVTMAPVLWRALHPTIIGDDLIRIVRLIEHPLSELVFWPFYEHCTPLFEVISWGVWQVIGHDLRLAPIGFTIASLFAWVLVLFLLGRWLLRETGSRTASFIAVALVAESPLMLQTSWFYSASSFSWALVGILLAVVGVCELSQRPRRSFAMISIGAMIGPMGTSLGLLAAPLAVLRLGGTKHHPATEGRGDLRRVLGRSHVRGALQRGRRRFAETAPSI